MFNYGWNQNQQWPSSSDAGFNPQNRQMSQAQLQQQQFGSQNLRPGIANVQTPNQQFQMQQLQQQGLLQQSNQNFASVFNQQGLQVNSFVQSQQYMQYQQLQQQLNQQQQLQNQNHFTQQQPMQNIGSSVKAWGQGQQQQQQLLQQFQQQPPMPPGPPPDSAPNRSILQQQELLRTLFNSTDKQQPPPPPPPPPPPTDSRTKPPIPTSDPPNDIESTVNKVMPFVVDIFSKVGDNASSSSGIPGLGDLPVERIEVTKSSEPPKTNTVETAKTTASSWRSLKGINDDRQHTETASLSTQGGTNNQAKIETNKSPQVGNLSRPTVPPPPPSSKDPPATPNKHHPTPSSVEYSTRNFTQDTPNLSSPKASEMTNDSHPQNSDDVTVLSDSTAVTRNENSKVITTAEETQEVRIKENISQSSEVNSGAKVDQQQLGNRNISQSPDVGSVQQADNVNLSVTENTSTATPASGESAAKANSSQKVDSSKTVIANSPSATVSQTYDMKTLNDFDVKFRDWEKQFDSWKLQNKNHKDQQAYKRYMDQWTHWRTQLLNQRKFIVGEMEKQKRKAEEEERMKLQREIQQKKQEEEEKLRMQLELEAKRKQKEELEKLAKFSETLIKENQVASVLALSGVMNTEINKAFLQQNLPTLNVQPFASNSANSNSGFNPGVNIMDSMNSNQLNFSNTASFSSGNISQSANPSGFGEGNVNNSSETGGGSKSFGLPSTSVPFATFAPAKNMPVGPNPFLQNQSSFGNVNQGGFSSMGMGTSGNLFDQRQSFGNIGFGGNNNFSGSNMRGNSIQSLFPSGSMNNAQQKPGRVARLNLFDNDASRPGKSLMSKGTFDDSWNAVDDGKEVGDESYYADRFANEDRESPPPKMQNRGDENPFDINPFSSSKGSRSNNMQSNRNFNDADENPWIAASQQGPRGPNPFDIAPSRAQQPRNPFDISESFNSETSNDRNSFSFSQGSNFASQSGSRSNFSKDSELERFSRRPRDPFKMFDGNDNDEDESSYQSAVIDYGHGDDVPDDVDRFVEREQAGEQDDPNYDDYNEDDDDGLKDSVTIDYGHGSGGPFDLNNPIEQGEVPLHPRDYYDNPDNNSFGEDRENYYGSERERGGPGEFAPFYRGRGPGGALPLREDRSAPYYQSRDRHRPHSGSGSGDGPGNFSEHSGGSRPRSHDALRGRSNKGGHPGRLAPPLRTPSPSSKNRSEPEVIELSPGSNSPEGQEGRGRTRNRHKSPAVKIAPPRDANDPARPDRTRERERSFDHDKDKERDKDRSERDRDRLRDRDRDRERDRERERERERDRDRNRERDRERDRERERDKDKDRDKFTKRENFRDREKDADWKYSRGRDSSPRKDADSYGADSKWGRNSGNSRRLGRSRSRSPCIDKLVNPPPPTTVIPPVIARPQQADSHVPAVLIEDILSVTGRKRRPSHIVIILRGLPGSGKSYVAKLIKDREIEIGGSAPRILSLDDYFMTDEIEKLTKDPVTGKDMKEKVMQYEYEPLAEPSYRQDLIKTFKKTVENGYFPFIIVDSVNDRLKYFEEMIHFAALKRFQVYIAEMEDSVDECVKRNIHERRRDEIVNLHRNWEKTPPGYVRLDVRTLLQDEAVQDVEMEDVCIIEDIVSKPADKVIGIAAQDSQDLEEEEEKTDYHHAPSKWETIDHSEEKLNKLDGLRRKRKSSEEDVEHINSVESWLQRNLPDDYSDRRVFHAGKKRVRWADIEERREQEKMRDMGFVVGHTDWNRMMDPTFGSSALTKTKFI